METSHYITLPCKVTNDSDPVNKLQNFTVSLPEEFNLQDDWEIGLCEISFPKIWFHVPFDQYIDVLVFKPNENNYFSVIKLDDCKIEKGDYIFEALLDEVNRNINKLFSSYQGDTYLKTVLDKKVTHKPRVSVYENWTFCWPGVFEENEYFYLRFDDMLGNLLGFDKNAITNKAYNEFKKYSEILTRQPKLDKLDFSPHDTPRFRAWKNPNMHRNLKNLYVTIDLVRNSRYREKNSNLIRIVDIPEQSKIGDQITQIYNNVYYFPLVRNSFDKIKVEIFVDDSNDNKYAPFSFGEIYLILHLRKVDKNVKIELEPLPVGDLPAREDNPERELEESPFNQ